MKTMNKTQRHAALDRMINMAGAVQQALNADLNPRAHGAQDIYVPTATDPVFGGDPQAAINADYATADRQRQPLQVYATSAAANDDLNPEIAFLSPEVPVSPYFAYQDYSGGINTMTSLASLERAINGGLQTIDGKGVEVAGLCKSYGLASEIDEDRFDDVQAEMQNRVRQIMDLIALNRLQIRLAAFVAIAANTAKTWGSSANPDADIRAAIISAHTGSGFRPTRVYLDETAQSLRQGAFESQATAGAFAGAMRSPQQLAGYLGISGVQVSNALARDSAGTLASVFASKVLLFRSFPGASRTDTSIMKTFVTNDNGQRFRVHQRQVNEKVWRVAVTYRETTLVTGPVTGDPVRTLTIS